MAAAGSKDVMMEVNPVVQGDSIHFIALLADGYHLATETGGQVRFSESSQTDYLGVAAAKDTRWVEKVGRKSTIVSTQPEASDIQNAESPVASFDGRWLAYLREERGRGRIWVRNLDRADAVDRDITPAGFNILEMSFFPDGSLVFAAAQNGGRPELFIEDQAGGVRSLGTDEARYPSVSPDGRWLAYSRLQGGNWNLWLRICIVGRQVDLLMPNVTTFNQHGLPIRRR